ncbi:V-type ATP synthase subunit D [Actinoplanes solisilvae]|uniref:V-type ATP synthase subunit D n=1 Tax=Actinoplanes solisilvae TaxID=2486853 RepID=UPI000FDB74BA|nr:V-type ATP synthase subunit D [Actinoplanes solisilvae]
MRAPGAVRTPPGRAGVQMLRQRLAVTEAGARLLARELTVLGIEAERLNAEATATGGRWHEAARRAQRRLDRAGQLVGDRGIRLAAPPGGAEVTLHTTMLMALRYPDGVDCDLPDRSPAASPPADAALVDAERAVREAVAEAARHAVATRAARIVAHEAELTRQRLRALEHRRIPALREALAGALARIEEAESADAVLRRWATSPARGLSPLAQEL